MDFHNTSLLRLAHLFEIMVERCLLGLVFCLSAGERPIPTSGAG